MYTIARYNRFLTYIKSASIKMPWELTFEEFTNPFPEPKPNYQLLYHYTNADSLDQIQQTGLRKSSGAVFAHQELEHASHAEKPLVVFQAPIDEVKHLSGGGTVVVLYRDIAPEDILGIYPIAWPTPMGVATGNPQPTQRTDFGARLGEDAERVYNKYLAVKPNI